jgi:DUF971 family protein
LKIQKKSLLLQTIKSKKTMIARPITVKAIGNYTIHVTFEDGTRGAVDLNHLAHKGVFRQWKQQHNKEYATNK